MLSKEESKESRLAMQTENAIHLSTNIGLLKENEDVSKLRFVSIPEEINFNKNDEVIFYQNPVLKSQLWAAEGWRNMKRGVVDGAALGFELGTLTCAVPAALTAFPVAILAGAGDLDSAYQLQVLLCGVAAGGISSVAGGALGPAIYPFIKHNALKDLSVIHQTIVQTTWENLIKVGQVQQPRSLQKDGGLSMNNEGYESFEFGSNERPFDRFIQIEPIQLRFIYAPFWASEASEQLTLRIVVRIKFFDKNKDELFKERIQIDEGPYTSEEWSNEEGFLLNTHMEKVYLELAEQIVASIQANNTFLLDEVKASH